MRKGMSSGKGIFVGSFDAEGSDSLLSPKREMAQFNPLDEQDEDDFDDFIR